MATDPRSSIDKAFALLRAIPTGESSGAGVSELARRAQLSKSTAHRLLAALMSNGAITRVGDLYQRVPGYDGAPAIAPSQRGFDVADTLTPYLAALFERSRLTSHLAYMAGTQVAYANKLYSSRTMHAPSRIGGVVPAHATGVGKALLAWDSQLADQVIQLGMDRYTAHTITVPAKFRRELADTRADGIAFDREELTLGLACIAAPVFGKHNHVVAALSVSDAAGKLDAPALIPVLQKIAAAAGRAYRNSPGQ